MVVNENSILSCSVCGFEQEIDKNHYKKWKSGCYFALDEKYVFGCQNCNFGFLEIRNKKEV